MRTKRTSAGAARDDESLYERLYLPRTPTRIPRENTLCLRTLKFLWCRITRADTIPKEHGASRDQPGFLLLCEGGSMVHRAQSRATHEDDCFLMKILDTSVKRNRLSPRWENGLLIHLTPPPRRSNPRFRATLARTRPSSRPRPGSSGSSPSSGCPSSSWWRT